MVVLQEITKAKGGVNHTDASRRAVFPNVHKSERLAHPRYRADIDGLRAIAVLSVVGFHAFPYWVKGGFIGVDIFFVISGFLISSIILGNLESNSFSFVEFYSRRIRRIFPALLVVLTVSFAFGWFGLLDGEFKQLGKHIAGGAGFVSNFVLWNESGYFDNGAETKPLLHLWSLSIEEQFYLAWPLLLWFAWKRRFNLFATTLLVTLAAFLWSVPESYADGVAAFYSPLTRFWELLSGGLLAYAALHKHNVLSKLICKRYDWSGLTRAKNIALCDIQAVFGVALIGAGLILIAKDKPFPGFWALLPTSGTILIIAAGAESWLNRTILSHRFLVWIGLISYPLYLWHWPLLSFAHIVENKAPSASMRIALIAVSILLAQLTYRTIEMPVRQGQYSRLKAIALIALMATVGGIGYQSYARAGRLPLRTWATQAAFLSDYDSYYDGKSEAEFWGTKSCFNWTNTYTRAEQKDCEQILFPGNQLVFLVGDSHSAFLGPSLKSFLMKKRYNLFQFSAASCTPFSLNDKRKRCQDINRYVLERIKAEKPNLLIIFADYMYYEGDPFYGEKIPYDSVILETIRAYRNLGAQNIILMGQIPTWEGSLPKSLIRSFSLKHREIPSRTYEGVDPVSLEWDKKLRAKNYPDGVTYLSLKDFLCDASGCTTFVGPNLKSDLIVFDYGHLTKAGAGFLTEHLISHSITQELNSGFRVASR